MNVTVRAGDKHPGPSVSKGGNGMVNSITIRAYVDGILRPVGTLKDGIFVQRIRAENILRIYGAAGVDVEYHPPLPPDTIIRHIILPMKDIYEIGLAELLAHPKAIRQQVGPKHPERIYLPYKFWHGAGSGSQLEFRFGEAV